MEESVLFLIKYDTIYRVFVNILNKVDEFVLFSFSEFIFSGWGVKFHQNHFLII